MSEDSYVPGSGAKDPDMHRGKEVTLLLNEDGQEVERTTRPSRRPLLPVGVWAQLENAKTINAVRCGTENEKLFYADKDYKLLLLTNRTIKIVSRTRKENHCYVPLENVSSYQVHRDAAFEKRFEDTSDAGAARDTAASADTRKDAV